MRKFTHIMTIGCRPKRYQAFLRRHPKSFCAYVVCTIVFNVYTVNKNI